ISTVSLDQGTQNSLAKADTAMQGFTTQIDGSDVQTVKDGDDVNFKSGKNIKLTTDGDAIEIATSDSPEFNTVELNTSGAIAENNSHAVTGHAVYEYLEEDGSGIKYFRAKSDKDDAEAAGEDSVAIGPKAKAEGDQSLAAGVG